MFTTKERSATDSLFPGGSGSEPWQNSIKVILVYPTPRADPSEFLPRGAYRKIHSDKAARLGAAEPSNRRGLWSLGQCNYELSPNGMIVKYAHLSLVLGKNRANYGET